MVWSGLQGRYADPPSRLLGRRRSSLSGDDIAFIDFDGFSQAEACLDLALFRATLCDLSLGAIEEDNQPLPPEEQEAAQVRLDELCGIFLSGYEEVATYSAERLALWDALTSVKDILDVVAGRSSWSTWSAVCDSCSTNSGIFFFKKNNRPDVV